MSAHLAGYSINKLYQQHLANIRYGGEERAPRGKKVRQQLNRTVVYDPLSPVITILERDLNYRFMMAEAYWILSGSDRVDDIAPWNKYIAEFSDDGETFFGAYGPKVVPQLEYCAQALERDLHTRQAVINIWRENPPMTKDVPCTINMVFYLDSQTDRVISSTVNMRSSDAWLGFPYDVFNFAMVLLMLCAKTNCQPGAVTLNLVNAHLYEEHFSVAKEVHSKWLPPIFGELIISPTVYETPEQLLSTLKTCRDTKNKAACLELWKTHTL